MDKTSAKREYRADSELLPSSNEAAVKFSLKVSDGAENGQIPIFSEMMPAWSSGGWLLKALYSAPLHPNRRRSFYLAILIGPVFFRVFAIVVSFPS
jgi:hypothetical protein